MLTSPQRPLALSPLRGLCRATLLSAVALSAHAAVPQPDLWPDTIAPPAGMDAADAKALQLLGRMSLEEKVGQMIQADIASITPSQLTQYRLGSILAGGGAAPGNDVRTSPGAWLRMTRDYARAALAPGPASHPPIPILFGIDAVHGNAKVPGATIFPHNVGLGAAHDPELVRAIGTATAEEVSATGVDWTFAPTVAVVRDVRWGRSYESYSESPELVASYAAQMVEGLQGPVSSPGFLRPPHTFASIKHFLGDGSTRDGRDQGDSEVSEGTLARVHGAGYPAGIRAGALIVMASYNSWHGTKMHASRYLLTDILKDRMGFSGFVVGDWNAQEQVPGCTKSDCPEAFLAGIDMLMAPDSWLGLYENTLAEVRSGRIPQQRIDDAVRRILRVKAMGGLLDRVEEPAAPAVEAVPQALGSAEHRALARRAVRESLVLLKNERGALPLKPSAHVLVVGKAADDIGIQSGGWSIDWQGDHNVNADFPGATSILGGIRSTVSAAGGTVEYSRYGEWRTRPDAAIVVFGEQPYAEFQGDRETLQFAPGDSPELRVLRRLRSAGIPVVSVFISGRPLWINPHLNASDAFVAAWLPGSEGEGVADVLFTRVDGSVAHDFTGRLGFSWPRTAMPVRFDDRDRVEGALFPLGYGLDYAHPAHVAPASEEPGIPLDRAAPGILYHSGHPTAPWSIYLVDGGAAVRLTGPRQLSPQRNLLVTQAAGTLDARWQGTAPAMLQIAGRQADLAADARAGAGIEMRYRLLRAPEGEVRIGIVCAPAYERHPSQSLGDGTPGTNAGSNAGRCGTSSGALLDLTRALRATAPGHWQTLTLSLACFASRGADLSNVQAPLAIEATGSVHLQIAAVRRVTRAGPPHCGAG